MVVYSECYERTVRLNVPGGHGTGFTINGDGRQWLVTAAHVVESVSPDDIEVRWRGQRVPVRLEPLPTVEPGADVAVFKPDSDITPDLTLIASGDGVVFSQGAYFLGYPYGLSLRSGSIQFPMVKKAILSGSTDSGGVRVWLLDGINNPGFSGGPVVFRNRDTNDWHVGSVVSSYLTEKVAEGTVPTNTGIIHAYEIRYATEAIDAFVG